MMMNRGPPQDTAENNPSRFFSAPSSSSHFPHFVLDKQRAVAVYLGHDERDKSRYFNHLQGLRP